jgi:hypothetical protein
MMMTKLKTAVTAVAAVAMLGASLAVATPAAAQPYKGGGWSHNHNWHPRNDNWRWRNNNDWGWHRNNSGVGAGIVGFFAGAMIGSALSHPYRGNAWCAQHYKTYNPNTGTFTGNDGFQHSCP